jgi:hypothetical protein
MDRARSGDHIAFSVSKSTLLETADRLKSMNAEFFLARSDTALYFFDYDNHVFELDTYHSCDGYSHPQFSSCYSARRNPLAAEFQITG